MSDPPTRSPGSAALAALAVLSVLAVLAIGLSPVQAAGEPPTHRASMPGDPLPESALGEGYVEPMAAVIARDAAQPPGPKFLERGVIGFNGAWVIPSRRATYNPRSGRHYATNKAGDPLMGIAFAAPVEVRGTWIAGQAARGVWAQAVRVIGYRQGVEVGRTDWHTEIGEDPCWFAIDLVDVDRVVFEARPVVRGAAFYAIDDFTFVPEGASAETVIDFEDCDYRQKLTGSDYNGLIWEPGLTPPPDAQDEGVHAPVVPPALEGEQGPVAAAGAPFGGAGTLPLIHGDFMGVIRGDATSFSFPPDSCGAVGTTQFVEVVNRNFAVYDKASGAELTNVLLGSFLPGSNGDPRVLFDPGSARWFVLVTDFNATHYLAVSLTDDAMGEWFKTSFVVSADTDTGCWPDYPTFGLDANYVYTASYMVGCGMSIFAVEKAPLIDAAPALGSVFAFRNLPFEGAIQPTITQLPVNYAVSVQSNSQLRMRSITNDGGVPHLNELGAVNVPAFSEAPGAPAMGSVTPLSTVDERLMNAVYRDGEVWTAHTVNVDGRAACAWYRIGVAPLALLDTGVVSDASLHYFFPALDVNAVGDVVMGFSGSNASQYAGCYYTGRRADDPPGEMAVPALYKAGEASQNNIDTFGRNRWGDYSLTTVDPADDMTFWTIQEYAHDVDIWGTWIAEVSFDDLAPLRIDLAGALPELAAPGDDPVVTVHIVSGDDALVPDSVALRFRASGAGSFQSIPMTSIGGDEYEANLTGYNCGDSPEYYFEAVGAATGLVTNPADAPASVYELAVGEVVVLASDDFETDQGWSVSGDANDGHWERGVPVGNDRGDPPFDADGSGQCYLTDNDPVEPNSDVDNGTTALTSPVFDVSTALTVSWAYWLNSSPGNAIGAEDAMTVEVATDPGGTNWTTVRTYTTASTQWRTDSLEVGADIPATTTLRLRFSARDLPPSDVVEAGVDAFRADAFDCVPTSFCAADVTGPAGAPDGNVDALDVLVLIAQWGSPCTAPCTADITGPVAGVPDGNVDSLDFLLLVAQWGSPASCP